MIKRSQMSADQVRVTFRIPAPVPAYPVSVVGTFNDWAPGKHEMRRRADGSVSVTLTLTPGPHHFRYLADGGLWFDDDHADRIDDHGSHLHL
jgi:1,4-alpha-glucan branching enzyme